MTQQDQPEPTANEPRVTGHPDDEHGEALARATVIRRQYDQLLNIGTGDETQTASLIADLLMLAESKGQDPGAVLIQAQDYVDESGIHDQPATQEAPTD